VIAQWTRDLFCFQFTWEGFLTGIMGIEGVDIVINSSEQVIVIAVPYYEHLASVIEKYSTR